MGTITEGILKAKEYEGSIFYKASCSCLGHVDTLIIEYTDELQAIQLTLYEEAGFAGYYGPNYSTLPLREKIKDRWQNFTKRVRIALRALFLGSVEYESSFLFENEDHIESYIKALQEGLDKIRLSKLQAKTIRPFRTTIGIHNHVENEIRKRYS